MKRTDPDRPPLAPEDQVLIDLIAEEYKPAPMSPTRQAAFRLRLAEKLERQSHKKWRAGLAVGAAAAAVVCLLYFRGPQPEGSEQTALSEQQETPLLYAFVDPDGYASDAMQPRSFLPGDYVVLANVIEGPEDQF